MMRHTTKHLIALFLSLVMVFSCSYVSAFAADNAKATITANDIKGTAYTENFSTLKEYIDSDLTVPGNPVTYTGSAVISAPSGKLDASNATITVAPGDGYYQDDLIFNGSAAKNIKVNADGTLSFEMHTGDLTWNNRGFPIAEGGMEFSAQGGDLNGQYHIRLSVNGLKCDGTPVEPVIVPVYIYIYGREFSDMASPQNPGSSYWGVGLLGESKLPYAEKAENSDPQTSGKEAVWNWTVRNWGESEGYGKKDTAGEPVLCDKATDDFYITWPTGVDASKITAKDVVITLKSQYGEERVLLPGGDQKTIITGHNASETREIPAGEYAVYSEKGETQISVNFVHWLTYPVYTTMTIEIKAEDIEESKTYDVDSVYVYSTQTGGGLDLQDTTVTVVSYYGIANIDELDVSDFYKNGGMYSYWAYSEGGNQGGGPGGPGGGQQGGGQQGGGQQGGGQQGGGQQGGGQQGGGPGGPSGGQQGGGQQGGGGGGMFPQGPQGDLFLAMNADGSVKYVTKDSSDPAIIMDSVKPAGWRGHSYFYTNYSSNETKEVEYEGKTYTFTLKQPGMLGQLDSPSDKIVPLPGYIQTIGGHYSDHMNAGWAFFLRDAEKDVGWTVTDRNLPFTDVGLYSSHCYDSVAWAYEKGITVGVATTTFAPDTTLTHAMWLTMLWCAAGKPSVSGIQNQFTDVQEGSWYYDAVLWAVSKGIARGTSDTTFSPDGTLTHEQAVAFLYRYANGVGISGESDFAAAAAWAKGAGIADVGGNPEGDCTRFQALSYLYRYLGE